VQNGLSFLIVIAIELCVVAFFVLGWFLWRRRMEERKRSPNSTSGPGED
jgi:uncharacterized protein YneF (UPF0154 family)